MKLLKSREFVNQLRRSGIDTMSQALSRKQILLFTDLCMTGKAVLIGRVYRLRSFN